MAIPRPTQLAGPSRDRILDLLAWEPLTVDELADRIGLTLNGIRSQLTALERDGLVERAGLRHAGTAGKPPVLYALSRAAIATRSAAYVPTLQALVQVMRERLEAPEFKALLTETGEKLGRPQRGMDARSVLEGLGGIVRESHNEDGAIDIKGARCPLAEAVREEPLTCEVVRSMLETTLERPVEICCQHGDNPRCGFRIAAEN